MSAPPEFPDAVLYNSDVYEMGGTARRVDLAKVSDDSSDSEKEEEEEEEEEEILPPFQVSQRLIHVSVFFSRANARPTLTASSNKTTSVLTAILRTESLSHMLQIRAYTLRAWAQLAFP